MITGIKQDKSDWEGLKTNSNKLVTVSTTNEKGSCTNKKGLNKSNESSLTCPTEIKFEKINGLYKDVVSNVILATDRAEWGAKVSGGKGKVNVRREREIVKVKSDKCIAITKDKESLKNNIGLNMLAENLFGRTEIKSEGIFISNRAG